MITAIPNPINPKPKSNNKKELEIIKIIEPVSATNPEYRAAVAGPKIKDILSPISLIENIQIENTVNPRAAFPSFKDATLFRKIALQSATAPSLKEAKKVIVATGSKEPFGIEMKGDLVTFLFF